MTTTNAHPRMMAYLAAAAAHSAAVDASDACECEGPECTCGAAETRDAAELARDAARDALAGSNAPRTWELFDDGNHFSTITATSARAALKEAREGVTRANYPDAIGSIWIDVRVRCVETDETDETTVQLDEDEPPCTAEDGHDWRTPHRLVGGLVENPGVFGNGGGIIMHHVCMHCGCARTVDTWAQRPDTGEQGLTSTSYEPGKYAAEVAP